MWIYDYLKIKHFKKENGGISRDRELNKEWYIYTVDYYVAIYKSKLEFITYLVEFP